MCGSNEDISGKSCQRGELSGKEKRNLDSLGNFLQLKNNVLYSSGYENSLREVGPLTQSCPGLDCCDCDGVWSGERSQARLGKAECWSG